MLCQKNPKLNQINKHLQQQNKDLSQKEGIIIIMNITSNAADNSLPQTNAFEGILQGTESCVNVFQV